MEQKPVRQQQPPHRTPHLQHASPAIIINAANDDDDDDDNIENDDGQYPSILRSTNASVADSTKFSMSRLIPETAGETWRRVNTAASVGSLSTSDSPGAAAAARGAASVTFGGAATAAANETDAASKFLSAKAEMRRLSSEARQRIRHKVLQQHQHRTLKDLDEFYRSIDLTNAEDEERIVTGKGGENRGLTL